LHRGKIENTTGAELIPLTLYMQFPLFSQAGRARFNDDQRIWGKVSKSIIGSVPSHSPDCAPQIYDICVARECPYFVVTNYYGWVFGVFSKGMLVEDFHSAEILIHALPLS
jgi:hypothetical protein